MTAPSNTIEELVGRVEAATGPDRALDHAIYDALKPTLEVYSTFASSGNMDAHWYWMASREYTASIDAALALAERVLPGWTVQVFQLRRNKGWGARVSSPRYDTYSSFEDDEHATDDGFTGQANGALALLVAILKALRSLRIKGDHNDEA